MPGKALVIDANIVVRAVLGRRVRVIIETYAEQVSFFVPEMVYAEAEQHLPALVIKRGGDPDKALRLLRSLRGLVELADTGGALAIRCPIWTEDTDFFGCVVPTWTTSRIVVFLREP